MRSDEALLALLPLPEADANKYSRGKLVVVAGSECYPGAAVLAARAGQRMGAGYTEVVTDAAAVGVVRAASASLVVRSLDGWKPRDVPESLPGKPCAVCIGPGFVPDDERAADLVWRVLGKAACPVLVDGGGLARLASKKALAAMSARASRGWATVATPHGGEAARLASSLGVPLRDGEALSAGLALALGALVVLKGPDTFISDGVHTVCVREGTPALAKAGTGDVLAGMIAALLAQGLDGMDAAELGSVLHARAGRAAAATYTDICATAEDVVEAIPDAIKSLAG